MATRELLTRIHNDKEFVSKCFNISATVGMRGKNDKGDVMLVQALLKYVVMVSDTTEGASLIRAGAPLIKAVNGYFDAETARSIRWFQFEYSSLLISRDGLVHPASFKNRKIKIGGKGMMITQLNSYALRSAVFISKTVDYTEAMFKTFPQLKLWVKDV